VSSWEASSCPDGNAFLSEPVIIAAPPASPSARLKHDPRG
jgi:hypothetical protein